MLDRELEYINTKANNKFLVEALEGSLLDKILLMLDLNPTFSISKVPFQFEYCLSLCFVTDKGNYLLVPSMTSNGIETFWSTTPETYPKPNKEILFSKIIKQVKFKSSQKELYPYKLTIVFDEGELQLICGEIYDDWNDKLKYSIYDEMILLFPSRLEALKFEKLITYD